MVILVGSFVRSARHDLRIMVMSRLRLLGLLCALGAADALRATPQRSARHAARTAVARGVTESIEEAAAAHLFEPLPSTTTAASISGRTPFQTRRTAFASLVAAAAAASAAPACVANDFGCTKGDDDYFCLDGKLRANNGLPAWTPPAKDDDSSGCGPYRCGPLSKGRKPKATPPPPAPSPSPVPAASPPPA